METFKKIIGTSLLVLMSVLTASLAGAGLAIWDMNTTVTTVYGMVFPDETNETVIKDTQTIVMTDAKIPDKDELTIELPKKEGSLEANVAIPEQFITDDNSDEADDADETENTEALDEEMDSEDQDEPEEEPEEIVITSEIAGIQEIVKAGQEETIFTNNGAYSNAGTAAATAGSTANVNFPNPVTDYPREFTEVDISYFDDALFIGDSRMQGLGMYSKTNATFYAATAFQLFQYVTFKVVPTPNGKVPIFDAMQYDQFTKIYIKVGLNELGCVSDEKFLEDYQSFLDKLRAMQPRAIVYIHAVLPVTASKSQTDRTHCNEKIAARNESLKAFAQMNNCYYIDVSEAFTDETGALRADSTADGIHMAGRYMQDWIEYLRKHAVPWP